MKWERVTIFISSTFNDMHAERDYLVKDVFPELREWCEERKIHLVDVDLRWGVTEADSSSNHTVLACLNNIDESRPFFLCFLGQRRGWVPEKGEVSPETFDEYPGISDAIGRNSVTEMEIEHALLSPMKHIVNKNEKQEIAVEHALFYFRNPEYLDDLTDGQRKIFTNEAEKDIALADREHIKFKGKIKTQWDYTVDYDCNWDKNVISPELPENVRQGRLTGFSVAGKDLKDIITERLKEEIIKEFPDREKVEYASGLERDLDQQALFIELNSEGFISREGDFDALNDYLTNGKNGLFVLTASAGSGKSMLLANFIIRKSQKYARKFINRFCGVSDLCSQQYSLWKTVFEEARIECPDTLKDLKDNIKDLLKKLAGEKTVLVIDAVNQLPDGLDMLEWLPEQLPKNLKIILSLKEDEKDKELTDRIEKLKANENISHSTVKSFKSKEEKKKLINDYLKKYLKALDDKQISTICAFEGSKNPLYLKILLSELRVFGSFGQLSKEIQQFGETPKEAFDAVLNRLENDINSLNIDSKTLTPILFGLLANARNGLSEKETVSCIQKELGIDEGKLVQAIRLFIRQVRPFMARREGRTDYFYEAFKLAAKERYINNKVHYNELLADYFKEQADPEADLSFKWKNIRDFNELPYHLMESGNTGCLEKILSTYLWIKNKSELSDIHNTINDYDYIDVEDGDNYHMKLIRDTLIMSSHILKDNIKSLPTQLWGRLKTIENPGIKALLIEIDKHTAFPWLKPRHYMNMPGDALKVTLTKDRYKDILCFSSDGKYVLGSNITGNIRDVEVWDWEKQEKIQIEQIQKLEIKHTFGSNMPFSPDGKYIAFSIVFQNRVEVWDLKNRKEIRRLEGHTRTVSSICFSSDGKYIVSGSEDKTVRVWDWENQKELRILEGHTSEVNSVCFSPNGRYIVSGSVGHLFKSKGDTTVRVWDWENNKEIRILGGHESHRGQGCSVCFSPDGRYIASSAPWNGTVRIWDWENNKEAGILEGHASYMGDVCFSPDGRYIASGCGHSVRVWDWENNKEVGILEGHTSDVGSVCFSPDGRYIVSGDNFVRVWDWKVKAGTQKTEKLTGWVMKECFSPDRKYIVVSKDNTIRVWDWENHKEAGVLEGHTNVWGACFSPDGKYIASSSSGEDYTTRVWDWENHKEIQKLQEYVLDRGHPPCSVRDMYFSPDGRYLVLGSSDRSVRVWDWKNNKEIRILEGHTKSLDNAYVCFSPDGRYIASLASGTARIWDWENNNEIRRLKIDSLEVSCSVCFSPDRKYIAFSDHTDIRIWDWENQKEMRIKEMQRLKPYEYASYRHVCFSPDGRYIIASGSRDMTLYVWDLKNLKEVQSPIISLNAEENIRVFSNNSRQIVGTGSSGQILIYDIENLTTGIAIVTALRDLNNHLSVRCKYCGQVFDIPEDKSGKTVKCPHCNEELQINDFTADPIIIEDKSIEVETDKFNIPNENSNDPGNIAENNNYNINYNVLYTEVIDRSERLYSLRRRFYVLLGRLRRHPGKLPTQKKKGFFSRLFGRNS